MHDLLCSEKLRFLGPHDLHNASRLLFFTTRRGVVETETLRLGVMSAHFFLAGRKAADIGALLSKCPFSLFLWLAVWRPSLVSLEAHAELPG